MRVGVAEVIRQGPPPVPICQVVERTPLPPSFGSTLGPNSTTAALNCSGLRSGAKWLTPLRLALCDHDRHADPPEVIRGIVQLRPPHRADVFDKGLKVFRRSR